MTNFRQFTIFLPKFGENGKLMVVVVRLSVLRPVRCSSPFLPVLCEFLQWLSEAKDNMTVACNMGGPSQQTSTIWHIQQGMFSGTKSTDLLNTLLNLAYYNIAIVETMKIVIDPPAHLYNVHQGDDVWTSSSSPHTLAAVYYVMNHMGLTLQAMKQMCGNERGEFLRVLFQSGEAYGYLVRAMSNLILKEVQSPLYQGLEAMAATISDTLATLARRGLHMAMCQLLHDNLVPHWCKIRAGLGDRKPLTMPSTVTVAPRSVGGLGAPYPHFTLASSGGLPSWQIPGYDKSSGDAFLDDMPSYMTDDWISSLSKRLPEDYRQIDANALRHLCLSTSYASLSEAEAGARPLKRRKKAICEWRDSHMSSISKLTPVVIPVSEELRGKGLPDATSLAAFDPFRQLLMNSIPGIVPVAAPTRFALLDVFLPSVTRMPEDALRAFEGGSVSNSVLRLLQRTHFRSLESATTAFGNDAKTVVNYVTAVATAASDSELNALSLLRYLLNTNQLQVLKSMGTGTLDSSSQLLLVYQPEIVQLLPMYLTDRVVFDLQFHGCRTAVAVVQAAPGLWCAILLNSPARASTLRALRKVHY